MGRDSFLNLFLKTLERVDAHRYTGVYGLFGKTAKTLRVTRAGPIGVSVQSRALSFVDLAHPERIAGAEADGCARAGVGVGREPQLSDGRVDRRRARVALGAGLRGRSGAAEDRPP